jgi:hypothetical protein
MVPGPPEEAEADAPPSPASEEEDRAADVGGNRVAEDEDGNVRFMRQEVKTFVTRTLILNVRFVR